MWSVAPNLTDKEQYEIGKEIAQFLNELHLITDDCYDIGHYIPTIPRWRKTWKEGHCEYAEILKNGLLKKYLGLESRKVISKAFEYIYANIDLSTVFWTVLHFPMKIYNLFKSADENCIAPVKICQGSR